MWTRGGGLVWGKRNPKVHQAPSHLCPIYSRHWDIRRSQEKGSGALNLCCHLPLHRGLSGAVSLYLPSQPDLSGACCPSIPCFYL